MHDTPPIGFPEQSSSIAEVLYACISPTKSDFVKNKFAVLSCPRNWKRLFEIAEKHKVLPQLYRFLLKLGSADIIPELISELHRHHVHRQKRNLLCTYELSRLVRILEDNAIHAVAFKGPTLSQIAYNSLDARSFTDLDILVRENDYFKVGEVLKYHGYSPFGELQKSEREKKKFYLQAGEYTLFKENGNLFIDTHYRCLGGNNIAFSSDFSLLWQRLESLYLAGTEISVFSKADTLIYLCMNGTKDGWQYLRNISDIAMFISNSPELNWEDVNNYSRQLSLQTAVVLSLSLVKILTGVAPPENVLECPKPKSKVNKLAQHMAQKITQNIEMGGGLSLVDEVRIRFFIMENSIDRIRYLRSMFYRPIFLLFAINSVDKEFIKLPRCLGFLYYPARLIRVLTRYKQSTFKFLIK